MARFSRADLPWVFELATLAAVILGLSFAAMELRQLSSQQESQTLLQLASTMRSEDYVRASNLVLGLPEGLTAEELREWLSEEDIVLLTQFQLTVESLGLLVFRGDISIEYVDELFRLSVITSWDRLKPLTYENRARTGYLGYSEWHQWLAERLMERSADQPVPAYEAYQDWEP